MNIEEKAKQFNEILVQAITLQTGQVADCITKVVIDNVTVTSREHIFEWVENMDSKTHSKIKGKIEELSDPRMSNKIRLKCVNETCQHEYESVVDLNPINFF